VIGKIPNSDPKFHHVLIFFEGGGSNSISAPFCLRMDVK
jgi:hypothetical protein